MKSKFISILSDVLSEIPNLTVGFLVRESMEYKMMRAGGLNPKKIYQGFNNLKHRQIFKSVPEGFVLTSKGNQWLYDLKFKQLRFTKKRWDRKWRIVIFDVPEQFKRARHILRSKLKSLDFIMVQRSVFICPFPCEKEIAFLAQYLKIVPHIEVLTAISAGSKEEELKRHYNLK